MLLAIRRLIGLTRFLANSSVLLLLSFVVGLAFGDVGNVAVNMKWVVIPSLAAAMAVSTIQVPTSAILNLPGLAKPALASAVFNYGLQSVVMLGAAYLLIPQGDLWIGFVLIALTPPAISTVAFTDILKGNTVLSLLSVVGGYLAAFVIAPVMAMTLLGQSVINPVDLLVTLAELVLLPLALSRLLLRSNLSKISDNQRGLITTLFFCLSNFVMFGVNRNIFLARIDVLLGLVVIAILATFVLGYLTEYSLRALHVANESALSLALLSTMKNTGMAAGIALTFFSTQASLPAAVVTAVNTVYVIWLGMSPKRKSDTN